MVAPLGEKASPLEKDKASGSSKDWSLCPLKLIQALLELLHAPLQLIWIPLELPKALTMPFFLNFFSLNMPFLSQNVNIQRFWTNDFGLRAKRIFCWHFYAWRRGRILIVPACTKNLVC